MKTIKKTQSSVYENIIMIMDKYPGLLSALLTLVIVTGCVSFT